MALARTQWTSLYLHPDREFDLRRPEDNATLTYDAQGDGITFSTEAMAMEITGPVAAKMFVSSDPTDADLFLVLRVLDPQGKEVDRRHLSRLPLLAPLAAEVLTG
jgi:hypothetical protein